jgi:hypothetical protein
MKIRNKLLVIAVLGTMAGLSSDSLATGSAVNGSICKGVDAANQARIAYTQWGVHNTVTAAGSWNIANVICPFPVSGPSGADLRYFAVRVYDRSSVYSVGCTLLRLNHEGDTVTAGQFQQTSASGWSWSPTIFTWDLGDNFFGNNYVVTCSIPPIDSAVGYPSHVTSIGGSFP